ncbi:MAG TPA: hypothetical protein VF390_03125 [Patescibacteria group bacterium]
MNLENALSIPIQILQGVVFTPVLMLVAVLSFIFLLVFYHWSGLAEKVENMATGKKALVFLFVSLVVFIFYYVFYKAGKFDELINNPIFNDAARKIGDFINRRLNQ